MKNLFKKICRFFRSLSRRLRLLWHILKNDKDYDYAYLYRLLYIKFSNMINYFETDGVADMRGDIDKIKYCRNICKRLIKCEKYPKNINILNAKRFFRNEKDFEWWQNAIQDTSTSLDLHINYSKSVFLLETYYDIKARTLLFKLMDTYIESWWD